MPEFSWGWKRSIRGTPCFCFLLQAREREGERGARWLPIGSSYPLDDVYGVQLSTLHSKRPFYNPRESHPLARTLLSSKKTPLYPLCCRPPAPSCPLPSGCTPGASCGMTGAGWRWAPTPVLRRHLFSSGMRGLLVLAGWSRGVEGLSGWRRRGGLPPGRGGNKRRRALSHALFCEGRRAPVKR